MKATSLKAYENKKPQIPTDHQRILGILKNYDGLTYNEIADKLRWRNPNKVSRRLPELVKLNKIRVLEERKCTIAKSTCQSYIMIKEIA